jgi:hypothetical protein
LTNAVGFGRVPVPLIVIAAPVYLAAQEVVEETVVVVVVVFLKVVVVVFEVVVEVEPVFWVVVVVAETQEELLRTYPVRQPEWKEPVRTASREKGRERTESADARLAVPIRIRRRGVGAVGRCCTRCSAFEGRRGSMARREMVSTVEGKTGRC